MMRRPETAAVFGGGFGLYGYVPALAQEGMSIVIPERWRDRASARPDLLPYLHAISWVADEDAALAASDVAVIAIPPAHQPALVWKCLHSKRTKSLMLEKPLAVTPTEAAALLARLDSSAINFRIGYHFRLTGWGAALLEKGQGVRKISWKFRAHHYEQGKESWKRRHAQGGGALRFYGIHLIALMAEMGYDDASSSILVEGKTGEAAEWRATMIGRGLPDCVLEVSTNDSEAAFSVSGEKIETELRDPFDNTVKAEDRRIHLLHRALRDLQSMHPTPWWYGRVIDLWHRIETITIFD